MKSPMVEYRKGDPVAHDGHIARSNGRWADDKLSFLDRYLAPALTVAARHFCHRVYVDLFAGPGVFFDARAREFLPGGAIRVLDALGEPARARRAQFTHAILVNLDEDDHDALTARVDALHAEGRLTVPRQNIQVINDDANAVVRRLARMMPPRPYVFAFVDPEKPGHWPWASCQALRASVPGALDLYLLYPGMMGVNRAISYRGNPLERALTAYFGCDDWRRIARARRTDAESPEMRQELEALYERQLATLGLAHVLRPRRIYRTGACELYTMFFASRKPVALKLAEWEMDTVSPQLGLFAG
ncbi:MAG: three-Cys-motif partner protein TcmP [Gemmatimonadaceae bacterium]|nr:three-Cys-motif partner protein TcmP [Gemmatimonadaceae bacterium]